MRLCLACTKSCTPTLQTKPVNQCSRVSNSCQYAGELQRSCPGNSESHGDNRQEGFGRQHEADEPEHHCFLHRRRSREVKSRMLRLGTLQVRALVLFHRTRAQFPTLPSGSHSHCSFQSQGPGTLFWPPETCGCMLLYNPI